MSLDNTSQFIFSIYAMDKTWFVSTESATGIIRLGMSRSLLSLYNKDKHTDISFCF